MIDLETRKCTETSDSSSIFRVTRDRRIGISFVDRSIFRTFFFFFFFLLLLRVWLNGRSHLRLAERDVYYRFILRNTQLKATAELQTDFRNYRSIEVSEAREASNEKALRHQSTARPSTLPAYSQRKFKFVITRRQTREERDTSRSIAIAISII